ncbi:MAG: DUF2125 domain-containing protein [Pseudomonadota bacterium]
MRKLIIFIVVAALLYAGYWFIGRNQVETRLTDMLRQIDGGSYALSYDSLNTVGFPSRFDTTITALEFEDRATAIRWTAPFLQIFALAYRPNEVIAVFPPEQQFRVNGLTYNLLTDDMRASGKVGANTSLDFRTATVTMDNPRLSYGGGPELAMASVLAALRLAPETANVYDVYLEASSIVLPEGTRRFIDPGNLHPSVIDTLRLDSRATLSETLALNAATDAPPELERLAVTEFAFVWGEMSLTAIGEIAPDDQGRLNGSVTLTGKNWMQAIDLGVANGMIEDSKRFLWTEIARNLDETPDFPDTLTMTLTITDGMMMLGTFPLGPAPILR